MFRTLIDRITLAERKWRRSFGTDITDPRQRRRSRWHYNWLDHAALRVVWHNFREIAPGVYRSNQPTHARLDRYARMGVRTVLNLRGEDRFAHFLFLQESCAALGLALVSVKMSATKAPRRAALLDLIEAFRTADKPVLIHCKSGADRTGLAAALYLMLHEGVPVAAAKRQLHWRHVHFRHSRAGVMDYLLDLYEAHWQQTGIGFEDWVRTEYSQQRTDLGWAQGAPVPAPALPAG